MLVGIAFLFGKHGWAAEPLNPHPSFLELPAGTGMTAGAMPPGAALPLTYRFEIAAYLKNNQKSEGDSNDFDRIMHQISGWNSEIDATENTYIALKTKCTDHKLTCDVVGLEETQEKTVDGTKITILIDFFTTPATHTALHSSQHLNGYTIDCYPEIMDEKSCRKSLMNAVANKLVGLDKLHRPQGGGN